MSNKKVQVIKCLDCGQDNQFSNTKLLNMPEQLYCETCNSALLKYYTEPLDKISPDAFVHPLDLQMQSAMKKIPGIDSLLKTALRHSFELAMRLHHQGNFVQVSKNQLKSLYRLSEKAATELDLGFMPEIFVVPDAKANAYTFGVEKCAVAISSGCLDLMEEQEVLAVLAHEFGHIKANHVLYKTAARILSSMAEGIAQKTLGIGGLMLYPLNLALLRFDRASELSSDRAALLVVKNPQVLLNTLMKLAGGTASSKELNIKAFIEQAENFEKMQDEGPLGSYIAMMNSMFTTHPFPIWRAREIIDWVKSGDFLSILQGRYQKIDESTSDQNNNNNLDQKVKNFQQWLKKKLP